ncbi:diguanylate cyclase [Pseudomonadota bacterium]
MTTIDIKQSRVLIIDDSPVNIRLLGNVLHDEYQVSVAKNYTDALDHALNKVPDLILLDIESPDLDAYRIFGTLQNNPCTKEIPIIIITAMNEGVYESACLELGAIDFIKKPFNPKLVKLRVQNHIELKMLRDYYKAMSCIDELTGLPNRRQLNEFIAHEWDRASRSDSPLSVIMIDIDCFKPFNDNYGHAAGDECLKQVADALASANTRATDLYARYGGEEFTCVLPETDANGAAVIGQKLLHQIADLKIPHAYSKIANHITISLGVATMTEKKEYGSPEELMDAADKNLYHAKSQGRNRMAC